MRPPPYPPPHHATKRATIKKHQIVELLAIPGVGRAMAKDLVLLGINRPSDLCDKNPDQLYQLLCDMTGVLVDPCVAYTFRCAHYYAITPHPDPAKLKWWAWKNIE